ncbi:unnamed protein product [Protopolystoma xenopodis]|uniref:Uncharacterized protein n=1 Tax=Protopolystoma xenopodis TaxID=117903 RepID=A0A448WJ62_9PLAT|nr:unnamed protein product [Protopolystoma xenopodis]
MYSRKEVNCSPRQHNLLNFMDVRWCRKQSQCLGNQVSRRVSQLLDAHEGPDDPASNDLLSMPITMRACSWITSFGLSQSWFSQDHGAHFSSPFLLPFAYVLVESYSPSSLARLESAVLLSSSPR